MRTSLPLLLVLAACGDDDDTSGPAPDTGGLPECGLVRGTTGILMYQEEGDVQRFPEEAPDASEVTTGVAGPLSDGLTWVAVTDGVVIASVDAGCNWERTGTIPSDGDWALLSGGDRVYAFDRAQARGAYTDDAGLNWSSVNLDEPLVGLPTVDPADPLRLRVLTASGVVTSGDGGESWSTAGAAPEGTLTTAAVGSADLDVVLAGGEEGAWLSRNAGTSWEPLFTLGPVASVAVHPDDAAVLFVQATSAEDGVVGVWRAADASGDWSKIVDDEAIDMAPGMPLYPLPGDVATVVAGYGPVTNSAGDPALALYLMTEGEGTHTVRVTQYFRMHQLAFSEDRWMAAVDSVP